MTRHYRPYRDRLFRDQVVYLRETADNRLVDRNGYEWDRLTVEPLRVRVIRYRPRRSSAWWQGDAVAVSGILAYMDGEPVYRPCVDRAITANSVPPGDSVAISRFYSDLQTENSPITLPIACQ